MMMIYGDENYHEYEDDNGEEEKEEMEDVWAYSGNFLWPALAIQACLYHLRFIPLIHLALQLFQIVTFSYFVILFMLIFVLKCFKL